MARIRTIKPDFFTSLTVTQLPVAARLTFIGLWTHVDDEGRCVAEARLIAAAVWPLDDNIAAATVAGHLDDLERLGLIARYTVNGRPYLQVCGWHEHQRINRPTESKIPPPEEADEPSPEPHTLLSEDSPPEGNREQGREQGDASAHADAPDDGSEARFEDEFWPAYPPTNGVKRDKAGARREFCKLAPADQQAAIVGARHKAAHFEQTGEQPPYAARFLKRRDFEDFLEPPAPVARPDPRRDPAAQRRSVDSGVYREYDPDEAERAARELEERLGVSR